MDPSIYGAHLLNMMRSWNRHRSDTSPLDQEKGQLVDYEILVVDIPNLGEITELAETAKRKLFGEVDREVRYIVTPFKGFSMVYIPLTGEYLGDGEYILLVDQLAFASYFIAELKPHLKNIDDFHKLATTKDETQ